MPSQISRTSSFSSYCKYHSVVTANPNLNNTIATSVQLRKRKVPFQNGNFLNDNSAYTDFSLLTKLT